MNKGKNNNLRTKRICEIVKEGRKEDYKNIKYVRYDESKPYVSMYAFVQRFLLKKFKYEDILKECKGIPEKVNTVSWALNYVRKSLNCKMKSGKIHHKDAEIVNISDMISKLIK